MSRDVLRSHHVTLMGDEGAPVIVLAHGFGCDQRMWRFVADDLARDHRVVLFDHIGSGRSDTAAWSPQRYSKLEGYRDDVIELLDALGLRQVTYVGHSISGSIGALAAIARPDQFARLAMLAPNPCFINDGDYVGGFDRGDVMDLLSLMDRNMVSWAHYLAPIAVKPEGQPELVDEMRDSLCAGEPEILRQFAQVVFLSDIRACLGEVTVPTLILQCSDDAIAPPSVGTYLQQRLPKATLRQMAATGHCPHLSHPAETVSQLRWYLSQPLAA
jgi:sigma-B regulation protein RsbQ